MQNVTVGGNDEGSVHTTTTTLQREIDELTQTVQDWTARFKEPEDTKPKDFLDEMAQVEERSRRDLTVLTEQHRAIAQHWRDQKKKNAELLAKLNAMDLNDDYIAKLEEQAREAERLGIDFNIDQMKRDHEQMIALRQAARDMLESAAGVSVHMEALNEVLALGLDRANQGRRRVERARRQYFAWRVVFVLLVAVATVLADQGWDLLPTTAALSVAALLVDNWRDLLIKRLENRTVWRIVVKTGTAVAIDRQQILQARMVMGRISAGLNAS